MGRRGIAKPSARAQIHGIQFEFVPVENPLTQPLGRAVLRAITLLHSAVSEWFTENPGDIAGLDENAEQWAVVETEMADAQNIVEGIPMVAVPVPLLRALNGVVGHHIQ